MVVEIVSKVGGKPIRLEASQLFVYNDDGTPVCVAGEYGPVGAIRVSRPPDADFNATLRAFGYRNKPVTVDKIQLNGPPAGAKLLVGPGA